MTSAELTGLKRMLRQLLIDEGTGAVIGALKKALPENSPKFSAVFQLETRLNMANRDKIRGVLSQEQLELTYNRLSADLIDLIDVLEEADFAPGGQAAKTGSILYKIPHTMQVEQETRCLVRLAFEEDVIIQNIERTGAVLQSLRVSEVMEVALIDPNEQPAFAIRPVNSTEQFLEKGDFTEWIFYVKPLRTGEYPLALRVSVVEVVAGKDRKKEIVLEERIQVLAEPGPEDFAETATFQNAGYSFSYRTEAEPEPVEPAAQSTTLRRLAPVLLILLIVGAGAWALGLRQELAWFLAAQQDTKARYEQYLDRYPTGRHREQAVQKIDSLDWLETRRNSTDSSYLRYLQQHPLGLYEAEARRLLDSLHLLPPPASDTLPVFPPPPTRETLTPDSLAGGIGRPPPPGKKTKPGTKREPVNRAPQQQQQPPAPSPGQAPLPAPEPSAPAANPSAPDTAASKSNRRSGFEMVDVAGGRFSMGSAKGDEDECPHELAVHSFKIGKYEVTQADWTEIMGNNPAFYKGCGECPVENVSWNDVQEFIRKAGALHGKHYRLPSEAEWEYAARGGQQTRGFTYAGANGAGAVAWNHGNTERPSRVGRKKANELGLFDMSGNVWEWCQDTYQPYPGCKGKASEERILRGGSWRNYDQFCRVSNRNKEKPGKRDYLNGFRLAQDR